MKKIIRIEKENPSKKQFLVNWMLHDRCVYDCSYCPPSNKRGRDDWLKISFSKEFVDKLESHLNEQGLNENVVVHFTGGEPTVWPKFIELVDHINAKGWAVDMTTNGSRSLAWWRENARKFNHISMSYHSEDVNDDEFVEKAKFIATEISYHRFFMSIMMNPARWDKCANMVERLLAGEVFVPFDIRPLQSNFGLVNINITPYTGDQIEYIRNTNEQMRNRVNKEKKTFRFISSKWRITKLIKKYFFKKADNTITKKREPYVKVDADGNRTPLQPNELIFNGQTNFFNWKCNIGIEQIFINSLGKIHGGTCLQGQLIGNIQQPNELIWPTKATVCKSSFCGCYTDIKITKWKDS